MKKNNKMLLLFAAVGVIVGSIVTSVLQDVESIQFLTKSVAFNWSPSADLNVIRYAIDIDFNVSLMHVLGVVAAVWVYRKV